MGIAAATPSESDQQEAVRLSSEANQAAILGDRDGAIVLLQEAAELDPSSSVVAYRLGRTLEDAGESEAAILAFCRYLVLEPDAPDAAETRLRTERLADPQGTGLSPAARSAFEQGVAAFDQGAYADAAQHFSRAILESPDWEDAYYNRGVSYVRAGRASAAAASGKPAPDRPRAAVQSWHRLDHGTSHSGHGPVLLWPAWLGIPRPLDGRCGRQCGFPP
jgi:tetratricopeptide (TPR) repeat protein